MKKLLFSAAFLLAGTAFSQAASVTLTPGTEDISTTIVSTNSSGITTSTLSSASSNTWYGSISIGSASGHVAWSQGENENTTSLLYLAVGAVDGGTGNFAAIKFSLGDEGVSSATLSFDITYSSSWGTSLSSFSYTYSATVYGFDSDGNATSIGTWTYSSSSSTTSYSETTVIDVTLSVSDTSSYSYYGLIFNAKDTSTLTGSAGVAYTLNNIVITYATVPEPSTFGLLAGLGALALVASRRRRRRA